MPGKKLSIFICIVIVMLLGVLLMGCGGSEQPEPSGELEYASAITEDVLKAFDAGDYATFSRYLDAVMKQAMPEDTFLKGRANIQEKIGSYISKEFVETQIVEEVYTVVIYNAKYTEEPADVKITITFTETDGGVLVSGLYFNSPKLVAQ